MLEYTTKEIVEGISNNDNTIIQYVYDKYFKDILRTIENYGGNIDDAFDIFQDVMLVIYEQLSSGETQVINNFRPYLITLCKFTWLKLIRDGKYNENKNIGVDRVLPEIEFKRISSIWSDKLEKERREKIFISSFIEMNSACQKIIRLIAYGYKTEDIATELGITLAYAYKRRKICIQKLIHTVKQKV